jgi:NAD+ synthase (glutamine-hydrolysing)
VTALALPSRHTDPRSTASARELAGTLGIAFEELPLEPLHAAARAALASLLEEDGDTTDENLQARLRMLILTAYLNRHGGLLLNTNNKTELSLGYGTLYGDLAGTLSVLGDVTKPTVYAVARWADAHRAAIPAFILDRHPTAELRPDQVDPFDYPVVAPAMEALVRSHRLPRSAEHKRWQHGVILKVSDKSFGTGRMMPITRSDPQW